MHGKLHKFFEKYKILTNDQFGFREGRSTQLACFTLIKMVTESLNSGHNCAAIFLDMSKAFDLVSHTKLLDKLHKYGVRGKAFDWVSSYLKDRVQRVEIIKTISKVRKVYFFQLI